MQIKYKRVLEFMPHCGDCGERLGGNGSLDMPYNCKCGYWRYDLKDYKYVLDYLSEKDKE